MDHKESYIYKNWCQKNGIWVYLVHEFEYQNRKLLSELNKGIIGKEVYKLKQQNALAAVRNSKKLHIAIERNKRLSIGKKIFYSDKKNDENIWAHDQIDLIYKMIYDKEMIQIK